MAEIRHTVVIIPTDGKPYLKKLSVDEFGKELGAEMTDHSTLTAMEPQYQFGLFVDDLGVSKNLPYNDLATVLNNALKTPTSARAFFSPLRDGDRISTN